MPGYTDRIAHFARLLPVLGLFILLAGTGCRPRPSTASPPAASAVKQLPAPPASEQPTPAPTPLAPEPSITPVQDAGGKPTLDAEAHIYQELLPTPSVEFQLTPHSQDAQLTADMNGQVPVIQIFSDSGIGSADVEIVSGDLPEQIILQFHLRGLERLRFTYDKMTVEVSLPKGDGIAPIESVMSQGNTARPITESSPYWMSVRLVSDQQTIPLEGGSIEVEVPPSFLAEQHRQFSIEWIDFYR